MTLRDLITAFESWVPPALAEPWDNTGLLLGDASRGWREGSAALLTIDLTEAVLAEAKDLGAALIIPYHPPIFDPLKRITTATRTGRVVLGAAEAGIAIYSPHTALDAVTGGVTDWLAGGLTAGDEASRVALVPRPRLGTPSDRIKVVTFVPEGETERLRSAMAAAGAGVIGQYMLCSFASMGAGTFKAGAGANPTVGAAAGGQLEYVAEIRLEMVCDKANLPAVLAALRATHSYEEPAIDVYPQTEQPDRRIGAGRVVTLKAPITPEQLAARLGSHIGARAPGAVHLAEGGRSTIQRFAVVPGAGGSLASLAAAAGCEALVTGEMKHHEVLAANALGLAVALGGHTETERGYLPRLRERLGTLWPGADVRVSAADQPPLRAV